MIKRSDLTNRSGIPDDEPTIEDTPAPVDHAALALAELRKRIERARTVKPKNNALHCADCFQRGRDAALRVINGDAQS